MVCEFVEQFFHVILDMNNFKNLLTFFKIQKSYKSNS